MKDFKELVDMAYEIEELLDAINAIDEYRPKYLIHLTQRKIMDLNCELIMYKLHEEKCLKGEITD